jgi:hypothetical protein
VVRLQDRLQLGRNVLDEAVLDLVDLARHPLESIRVEAPDQIAQPLRVLLQVADHDQVVARHCDHVAAR